MYTRNLLSLIGILFFGNFLVGKVNGCDFTSSDDVNYAWNGCNNGDYVHKAAVCTNKAECANAEQLDQDHYLYLCTDTTECNVVSDIGYLIISNEVYSCKGGGQCKKVTAATASDCTGKVDEFITVSGALKFCPDATATPVAIAANAGDFVVGYKDDNVFGIDSGKYGVVTVTDKDIKINSSAVSTTTYVDSSYKITDISTLTCTGTLAPKSFKSFTSGLGGEGTDISLTTSTNYLLVTNSSSKKYCKATLSSGNIKLEAVTDGNVVIGAAVSDILYPVLTNLASVTLADIKLLKCESSGGTCAGENGYILYGTAGTASSLALCASTSNGACTAQTDKGYFVNVQRGDKPYIKCTGSTPTCEAVAATGECSENTIGQLILDSSTPKLCLDGTVKVGFAASGTTNYYLVDYSADSTFVDSVTSNEKLGIVEVTETFMKISSSKTNVCSDSSLAVTDKSSDCASGKKARTCSAGICDKICDTSTGKECIANKYYLVKTSKGSELVTDTVDGYLYLCTPNTAECTEKTAKGYYTDGTKVYSCTGTTGKCNNVAPAAATACTGKAGEIIKDSNVFKFCPSAGAAPVSFAADAGDFMVAYGETSGVIYGLAANTDFTPVTVDTNSVTVKPIVDGYYLTSSTMGLVTKAGTAGSLYNCSATDNKCTAVSSAIPVGYLINGEGSVPYIECKVDTTGSSTTCKPVAVTATACSTAKAGGLIVDSSGPKYSLCLDSTTTKVDLLTSVTTSTYYMVSITGDGNVFGKATDASVVVDVKGGNAIKQDIASDGYYIVDETTTKYALVTAGGTAGTLYSCTASAKTCTVVPAADKPIGYVVNAGDANPSTVPYILCVSGTEGAITCKTVAVSATACNVAKTGGLIVDTSDGTKYKICIDDSSNSVELGTSVSTITEYIIGVCTAFGKETNAFVIIDVSKGNALLHEKEDNPDRYEFADRNSARINKSTFSSADNCTSGALKADYTVTEYKLKEGATDTSTNYYTKVSSQQ